jgi:hypothetical protein
MSSENLPVEKLIRANCEAISAANRIALIDNKDPQEVAAAQTTIDALEEITIGLIPRVRAQSTSLQRTVALSGSLRLANHVYDLIGCSIPLTRTGWSNLLTCIDPDRIRLLTTNYLSKQNLGPSLIDHISLGYEEYIPLVDEIGYLDPIPALADVFRRHEALKHTARLLKLQAERLPVQYHERAMQAAGTEDVDMLALFFILGVQMPEPDDSFAEGREFLTALQTNHGTLFAYDTLGTVEQYLADKNSAARWKRVVDYAQKSSS